MAGAPKYEDLLNLAGKVAVITGASQRIGAGIARRFAAAGARVVVHYRSNERQAGELVASLRSAGNEAVALGAELTDRDAVDALFDKVVRDMGGVDVLVNNAGTFPTGRLLDLAAEDWRDMFRANTETAFFCIQAAARRMPSGAAIVNVASIAALSPGPAHSHYNSAKAALVMLTRSAAQELGPAGIRVNAVSPGVIGRPGIEDDWHEGVARWRARAPLERLGTPEDVADACLFLAAPASRWISGHNLVVDGGVMAASIY